MRRPTRLGLAVAVLAVVVFGAYAAFWFVAAGRIEAGVGQFAQSLRAHNLDLSWRRVRVGGFPLSLRVELSEVRLRDRGTPPTINVAAPRLSASARPWDPLLWQVAAADGLSAARTLAGGAVAKVTARRADGTVAVAIAGGATVWLNITEPASEGSVPLAARDADLWLMIPPHPPLSHTEPDFGVALDVRALRLPAVPAPFTNPLDEIALGLTVMGNVPAAPPRKAVVQWHDTGGTIELNHLAVRWGSLSVTGSGTLALDHDLQPMGAFSGAIEGYGELMSALVTSGHMRAGDARLARLALAMLAKPGPDGRPEIATSFTMQDGEMYLGPVKLGKAPRIDWK